MKVNKNSWHFKLLKKVDSGVVDKLRCGDNITLCNYFWAVVLSGLKLLAAGLGITIAAVSLVALLLMMLSGIITLFFASWLPLSPTNAHFSFFGLFLTVTFGGLFLIEWSKQLIRDGQIVPDYLKFKKSDVTVEHKPNLLSDYLKAKKAKVCPLVTLED